MKGVGHVRGGLIWGGAYENEQLPGGLLRGWLMGDGGVVVGRGECV